MLTKPEDRQPKWFFQDSNRHLCDRCVKNPIRTVLVEQTLRNLQQDGHGYKSIMVRFQISIFSYQRIKVKAVFRSFANLVCTLILSNLPQISMNYKRAILLQEKKKEHKTEFVPGDTSSPIRKTEGSADISSSSAEFNASRTVI